MEHFSIALSETDRLIEFDISHNDIGPNNFNILQSIFEQNINLELLNIADCNIDVQ